MAVPLIYGSCILQMANIFTKQNIHIVNICLDKCLYLLPNKTYSYSCLQFSLYHDCLPHFFQEHITQFNLWDFLYTYLFIFSNITKSHIMMLEGCTSYIYFPFSCLLELRNKLRDVALSYNLSPSYRWSC